MRRILIVGAAVGLAALFCLRTSSRAENGAAPAAVSGAELAAADSLALEEARAAANALGKSLMKELLAALQRGGPPAAIAVCADSAQVLTRRLGTETLSIRRVTQKPRNPANAPDTLESTWLEYLGLKAEEGDMPPEMVAMRVQLRADGSSGYDRELYYMRPITIAEPCLKCHGDDASLAPEVKKVLAERYPKDRAIGYAVGDFRGGISVRVRIPERE